MTPAEATRTRFGQRPADSADKRARTRQTRQKHPLTEPRRALLSAVLGLSTYYGARAIGASQLDALMVGAVVSAIRLAYSALRGRRFDAVACFLLVLDGVSLVVGLLTRSPRMMMFSNHIPGVIFGVFVLGGLAMNKPITELIVSWIRPGWVEQHIAEHDWTDSDAQAYHRMHMRLSLAIAILQIVHLAAVAVIILTMPVDVARGVLVVIAMIAGIIIVAITLGGIGRFLLRHKTNYASTGQCPDAECPPRR